MVSRSFAVLLATALLACEPALVGEGEEPPPPDFSPDGGDPLPEPPPDGGTSETPDAGGTPEPPAVRFIGRFDHTASNGPRFGWSGSTLIARFVGPSVAVDLHQVSHGTDENGGTLDDRYEVLLDGQRVVTLEAQAGTHRYPLASGLDGGVHEVTLYKRTEGLVGEGQLIGFDFGGGQLLSPPPRAARRIELIGDSITAGYGNEGADENCPFTDATENHYLTYGAIAARALQAEQVTIAWSGKGIYRNENGSTHQPLPSVYGRTLPTRSNPSWGPSSWIPDVVVVNLGDNDFVTGAPPQMPFTEAYRQFLATLRSQYPNAHIICAIGPMMSDNFPAGAQALTKARAWISGLVTERNNQGDAKVSFLEFPNTDESVEGAGCGFHPNLFTHQKLGQQLEAFIRQRTGW